MPKYRCTVIDGKKQRVTRVFDVENDQALQSKVKELGYYLVRKDLVREEQASSIKRKLKVKDLIIFCRQMSIMVQSGITVIRAIDILESKTEKANVRKIYSDIYESMQKGNGLSTSMEEQKVFPQLLINMVSAGEASGTLETNLIKMAEHFEKENRLNNKIRGALTYPIILSIVTVAVVIFLVVGVLPSFVSMYADQELPWPTQLVLGLSNFLKNDWVILVIAILILVFVFQVISKIPEVRVFLDEMKLKLPIFGKLNKTIYSARCARTFSSLYASGIDIIDLLRMVASVIGNAFIQKGFEDVIQKVSRGEFISTSMDDLHVFDPMLISMLYIGEESGSIDSILGKAADYFDEESDTASTRMVSMVEPIMIFVMAIVIGFILVAVILPMYGSYSMVA